MKNDLIVTWFDEQVRLKRQAGHESTADLYRAAGNHFCHFTGQSVQRLVEINQGVIDRFIIYLEKKNLSRNSVNAYVGNLRAMYNRAMHEGLVTPSIHPFAHLTLKVGETIKRAIDTDVIKQMADLDLKAYPSLSCAVEWFLFSFLACGMPFVDLAHLTAKNISGDMLTYTRVKTGTHIKVGITPGMRRLIDKYASQDRAYLFPILPETCSHEEYKGILRRYNADLQQIAIILSIPHLSSYVARHSWATAALRHHIPVGVISQALGHTSEKTTRIYLGQLDQSELDQANKLIIGKIDKLVG